MSRDRIIEGERPTDFHIPKPPKQKNEPLMSRPITSEDRCNHRYKIIETETERLYADDAIVKLKVDALFYCEKCLVIKSVVEYIDET